MRNTLGPGTEEDGTDEDGSEDGLAFGRALADEKSCLAFESAMHARINSCACILLNSRMSLIGSIPGGAHRLISSSVTHQVLRARHCRVVIDPGSMLCIDLLRSDGS